MKIRLERESRFGGDIVSRVAVEIESDDPSYAIRKAKELLDHLLGEKERPERMAYEPPPGISRADIFGAVLLAILTAFLIWGRG